jgi:CRISPR-associated protein Csm5
MKYRVTCLTPTLVGDGQKLAPIDYMVWKDHVNVLDQRRIFRLLAKGPRLEGYLAQLKKAEKLDFASWGGFAQNFAGRRLPFEHSSSVALYERAHAADLFIPTFATNASGPYLPATALKGALRTGSVFDRWTENTVRDLAERAEDRVPRYFASKAEDAALGGSSGSSRMRRVAVADSGVIAYSGMKVYLLRTATLVAKGAEKFDLGWKSQRGSVDARRVDDSTLLFAEMASPGTAFDGNWRERSEGDRVKMFQASNRYAEGQLARHREYAQRTGLTKLAAKIEQLEARLAEVRSIGHACLLSIGWGGGLLGKSAYLNTEDDAYRKILRQMPLYQRAIQTGMPFPKTRRIIFEGNQPASLPGWVMLEVG